MRAHDHPPATPEQWADGFVGAKVEDVVLLPRRRDEDGGAPARGVVAGEVVGALAVDEVVAARGKLAGREAGLRLAGAGLAHLVGTHAHERVVVVEGRGVAHEVQRRRVVEGVDVARVLAHVGALDVEVLEVVEGHDHDVGVHLHHERDEALLAHVVGQHARVRLGV